MRLKVALAALSVVVGFIPACDNRQAFIVPEPALERMLQQRRGDPYGRTAFFADHRVMRTPPEGTVPEERTAVGDPLVRTGYDAGHYAPRVPIPVDGSLLAEGRATFDDVCAVCHGVLGDGASVVAEKMELRKPPSLHEPRIRALEPGKVFQVISEGYGFMPSYGAMLSVRDRWAVIAYLEPLRLSRAAKVALLPPEMRAELSKETR